MALGIFVLLLGSLLLWLGLKNRKRVQASMSWPSVQGCILSATVTESVTRGDEDTADSTSYSPALVYEYAVAGQSYRGNRISFQDRNFSSYDKASAVLGGFPVGGAVQVFHDPRKPANCVLERKAHSNNFLLIVGIIMIVVAIAAFFKH
jgi:hypothetical protein